MVLLRHQLIRTIPLLCLQLAGAGCPPRGSDGPADGALDAARDGALDAALELALDAAPDRWTGVGSLVCVFDIDSTLTCSHAFEAVSACKDLGARLAVNTAQTHDTALANKAGTGYVDWAGLGFPTRGRALDLPHGAYIFGLCDADGSCSQAFGGVPGDCASCAACGPGCPAAYMGKAYGMSRIAAHYHVADKRCLVLFDDNLTNTQTVELFGYSAHYKGTCDQGWSSGGVYQQVSALLKAQPLGSCLN